MLVLCSAYFVDIMAKKLQSQADNPNLPNV